MDVCYQLDILLHTGYEAGWMYVISLIFCYTMDMRLDGCVLSA